MKALHLPPAQYPEKHHSSVVIGSRREDILLQTFASPDLCHNVGEERQVIRVVPEKCYQQQSKTKAVRTHARAVQEILSSLWT